MATARPQVNPFFIEPAEQEWDGDYDWQNDDEDVEHEGLLDSTNNWDEDPDSALRQPASRRANRRSHSHSHQSVSPYRFRFLVSFGLIFIVFLVVLTLLGDSTTRTDSQVDRLDDNDGDERQQQQVQQIVVLGERASGVPWLTEQLQGLYPNITVTTTLQREGCWFQGPPDPDNNKSIPRTLIFAVFRDPYDWVEQMRLHPRFMPAHMDENGLSLPWRLFAEKEWTIDRPQWDHPPLANASETCQLGFRYDQVISCRVMDMDASNGDPLNNNPIYELQQDGSGKPFSNILALRAAKIKHILQDIPHLYKDHLVVADPIVIRYETENLHDYVKSIPPLRILDKNLDTTFIASSAPIADKQNMNMTMEYVQWMSENVNWKAETRLGYQARKDQVPTP
jgi:hypothetical protein